MYEQKWFWHIHTITEEDLENKQSKKNIDMRVISHKKTFCVWWRDKKRDKLSQFLFVMTAIKKVETLSQGEELLPLTKMAAVQCASNDALFKRH